MSLLLRLILVVHNKYFFEHKYPSTKLPERLFLPNYFCFGVIGQKFRNTLSIYCNSSDPRAWFNGGKSLKKLLFQHWQQLSTLQNNPKKWRRTSKKKTLKESDNECNKTISAKRFRHGEKMLLIVKPSKVRKWTAAGGGLYFRNSAKKSFHFMISMCKWLGTKSTVLILCKNEPPI